MNEEEQRLSYKEVRDRLLKSMEDAELERQIVRENDPDSIEILEEKYVPHFSVGIPTRGKSEKLRFKPKNKNPSVRETQDEIKFFSLFENPYAICMDGVVRQVDGYEHGEDQYFLEYDTTTCGCCYEPVYEYFYIYETFSTRENAEKFRHGGHL